MDPRREQEGGTVKTTASPQKGPPKRDHRSKTEGTSRNYDGSRESENQGHGRPREERGTDSEV